MRINWSEDEERPGQFELWQANCRRSLHGRKGQHALRQLRDELLSMTGKRLIADDLAANGEVCAVGALMRANGVPQSELEELDDTDDTDRIAAKRCGIPPLVAWKLVELNDIELELRDFTPEQRYERVLAWAQQHIV